MKIAYFLIIHLLFIGQVNAQRQSCPIPAFYLSTQEEVDNFALNNPDCINLQKLVIEGSITNLNGLSQIISVSSLTIRNTNQLTNLEGLHNITTSNQIIIENNSSLIDISALSSIQGYIWILFIQNNQALLTLEGLNNISSIGTFDLANNSSLGNLFALNLLQNIGALIIENNNQLGSLEGLENLQTTPNDHIEIINNESLSDISGLSHIQGIKNLYIYDNNALIIFPSFNNLTSCSRLEIGGQNITSIDGFNSLSHLTYLELRDLNISDYSAFYEIDNIGVLYLRNVSGINDMQEFSQLTFLDGIYLIDTSLQSLNGIEDKGVTSVTLQNCLSLTDFSALNGLTLHTLRLDEMHQLTTLSSFGNIVDIIFRLRITNNDNLESLTGLDHFSNVQRLDIINNNSLVDLNGLDSGGLNNPHQIEISENDNLVSLDGLNILQSSNVSSLNIYDNNSLISLGNGNLGVERIESLRIIGNNLLENINAFNSLQNVGRLTLIDNNSLTSILAFENLDPLTITKVELRHNDSLETCNADFLCEFLGINGWSEIEDNAPGCNSKFEIADDCGIVLNSPEEALNNIAVYPNPTSGVITITGVEEGNVKILNALGQLVLQTKLENNQLDLSSISNGMYFFQIEAENRSSILRLIKE